jgi:hypothetical protein
LSFRSPFRASIEGKLRGRYPTGTVFLGSNLVTGTSERRATSIFLKALSECEDDIGNYTSPGLNPASLELDPLGNEEDLF